MWDKNHNAEHSTLHITLYTLGLRLRMQGLYFVPTTEAAVKIR